MSMLVRVILLLVDANADIADPNVMQRANQTYLKCLQLRLQLATATVSLPVSYESVKNAALTPGDDVGFFEGMGDAFYARNCFRYNRRSNKLARY